jgi:Zn-dependent protease
MPDPYRPPASQDADPPFSADERLSELYTKELVTPEASMDAPVAAMQTGYQHIERYQQQQRRQRRTCLILFLLTFLSTFVVGAGYFPLEYLIAMFVPRFRAFLMVLANGGSLNQRLWESCINGLLYAGPLMLILLFHEMGHYLQSVRYRVPASLPYFIPMPLTILGTMGAVIFQGRGSATRRQMFDIAVSGPLAGLAITLPVLWIGISGSRYVPTPIGSYVEFGDPLIITWICELLHGPAPEGYSMMLNETAFAGWVGVLITAINLLPVGQLDGGHIAYTLLRSRAHILSMGTVAAALGMIVFQGNYSFVLLMILMLLTGVRHPPTADDTESLGWFRHVIGWLTLGFLIIGITPNPILVQQSSGSAAPTEQAAPEPMPARQSPGEVI